MSRIVTFLGVLALAFASGCSCPKFFGSPPPKPRFCHGPRLMGELAWFYADVNDLVFGIDYYEHMDTKYGRHEYP
jgi:hypothetical protein